MFVFTPPGSKSFANRALILASLTEGKSILKNFPFCEDTLYMIRALKKLGVKIEKKDDSLIVHGTEGKFNKDNLKIYCGNAGTTFRFLTALSILNEGEITLTGSKRMLQRPIGALADALKQLNVEIETQNGYPPVKIRGGNYEAKTITINSEISSQFLSALLLIMPILGKKFKIISENEIPSLPYVKLTLQLLEKFGVKINHDNYKKYFLEKDLKLKSAEIIIESDLSSSTYFLGSAAILKRTIKINGINIKTTQADVKFIKVLEKMGCVVEWNNDYVKLKGNNLKGISIDMHDAPDSVPTLAVVSLFAKGKTKIKNIKNLRYKESDRISALATEIKKLGAEVKEGEDFLEITPSNVYQPATIETYNDHRIAMSFALAQLMIPNLKIKNPECVKKSFPNFWFEFNKMRAAFNI
ncbi:MAG: 3-phosphoshikimate 1-carboxyvinyltransferase [Ignavibacteria bacterium]|nr:3-phosphoshikimate 1-carboxyvinyltransferase [Ignavibacteria bacterium]